MNEAVVNTDIDYRQSTRRLFWFSIGFGVLGTLVASIHWNPDYGKGFALGSIASVLNLWMWHAIAEGLSGKRTRRTAAAGIVFAGRILALFAFGYVIVRALNVYPLAAVLGLLTSTAAVIAEVLVELVASSRLSR